MVAIDILPAEIGEDVLRKVMEIVEDSGAQLALPTEIHYVSATEPIDDNQVTT